MKGFHISSQLLRDGYLVLITAVLFILFINLFLPFATTLLLALLMVALFQPMYKYFAKKVGKSWSAVISTIIVVLMVVIPISLVVILVSAELGVSVQSLVNFVRNDLLNNTSGIISEINNFLARINPGLQIDSASLQDNLVGIVSAAGNTFSTAVLALFQNVGGLFAQFIVFIISLALIFKDFDKIPGLVRKYVPLDNQVENLLLDEFLETGKGLIKGIFLVSLVHAAGTTLIVSAFGVQPLAVIFVLVFLASMIPGGSQLVWIPTAVIVGLTGGLGFGIILFAICLVFMNGVDTLVRPALAGGDGRMHPLLSLISILGGLITYGFGGLLYGPLIAVMFITIVGAYNRRFKEVID